MIRQVLTGDARAIADIYNYYIENTAITFEEEKMSEEDMAARIEKISSRYPYLVYEDDTGVKGYAYVGQWKERSAYRYSAEDSIYVHKDFVSRGLGLDLMAALLEEVKKTQLHAIVSGITLPNEKSVALHEKFGFKKIAEFKEIGYKFKEWHPVGYWELIL